MKTSVKRLILLLLMGVVCLAFARGSATEPTAAVKAVAPPPKSPSTGSHLDWPEIPYAPASYGTLPANTPDLRPVTGVNLEEMSDPKSPKHGVLLERLKIVVTQNIIPGVATELDELLRSHKIIYAMNPNMRAAASFSVDDGWPHLTVNSRRLAALDGQQETAGFMLVIGHEFLHYKQWRDTTDPVLRATFQHGAKDRLDITTCKHLWSVEREAYRQMNCEWGNRFGLQWHIAGPREDYCIRLQSPAAFSQAFYYAQTLGGDDDVAKFCSETWWDLAGGPRAK